MPTKTSRLMLRFLKENPLAAGIAKTNSVMDFEPPVRMLEKLRIEGTRARQVRGTPCPALWVQPKGERLKHKALLHLHGGAYVSGGLLQAYAVIAPVCARSGVQALTFAYRLAPEYPYPAQLQDALSMYDWLENAGYAAKDILLVGESAGGNLALALTRALRGQGRPLPAGLCLLSPWCDLMQEGESYETNKAVDATLDAASLMQSALDFAGGNASLLSDPMLCPLKADFHGFPPTQIHCGTHELLQSDSRTLLEYMKRDGTAAQLFEWAGMCHVFQIFPFEESRQSLRIMGDFIHTFLADGETGGEG